jgi:hypothetical protein
MKTDPILEIVLALDQPAGGETGGPPPEPTGVLDQLRCRSFYGVDSPRGDATPAPAKKRATVEETEKALASLRKRSGTDFRRLLAKHQHVLRSDVKTLVQSYREVIIAAYAVDEKEKYIH